MKDAKAVYLNAISEAAGLMLAAASDDKTQFEAVFGAYEPDEYRQLARAALDLGGLMLKKEHEHAGGVGEVLSYVSAVSRNAGRLG